MEKTKGKTIQSADVVKGILILLVIVGHVLLGTLQDNPFRYFIYAFHMPAFIFMSGYLFNMEKTTCLFFKELVLKYWNRMLMAWMVASIVYAVLSCGMELSLKSLVGALVLPYYHLWYVPSLFMMIVFTWVVFNIFNRRKAWFILLASCVIAFFVSFGIDFPRYFRYDLMVFFVLGMLCRQGFLNKGAHGGAMVCFLALAAIALTYPLLHVEPWLKYYRSTLFPVLAILVVYGCHPVVKKDSLPNCPLLSFFGKNSLPIYLWHVIPIMFLKDIFKDDNVPYYIISFGCLLLFCVVYALYLRRRSTGE